MATQGQEMKPSVVKTTIVAALLLLLGYAVNANDVPPIDLDGFDYSGSATRKTTKPRPAPR